MAKALYSSKRVCEATLSDGSTLRFILPRENHCNQATSVYMRRQADRVEALTSSLTAEQRAEVERAQAKREAAPAAAQPAERQSRKAQAWARFEIMDPETLVAQCAREWTHDGGPVVEEGDFEAVPEELLEEAARAIYAARVGAPDASRKN